MQISSLMMRLSIHINALILLKTIKIDDFVETKHWSKRNNLPINYTKTKCMAAGTKRRLADTRKLNIQVDGTCIENVSKHKL